MGSRRRGEEKVANTDQDILSPLPPSPRDQSVVICLSFPLQDFVFPDGVAMPLEGDETTRHILLEMHYDNPLQVDGA